MNALSPLRIIGQKGQQLGAHFQVFGLFQRHIVFHLAAGHGCGPADGAHDFFIVDGLEQIVEHAQLDGLTGVLKLIVTGNDDKAAVRHILPHIGDHIQPAFHRHPNIRQHNIRLQLADHHAAAFPVPRSAGHFTLHHVPVDGLHQRQHRGRVILNDYDFQAHSGSFLMGDERTIKMDSLYQKVPETAMKADFPLHKKQGGSFGPPRRGQEVRRYPFTAPDIIPDTMKRWVLRYKTRMGSMASIKKAKARFSSVMFSPK